MAESASARVERPTSRVMILRSQRRIEYASPHTGGPSGHPDVQIWNIEDSTRAETREDVIVISDSDNSSSSAEGDLVPPHNVVTNDEVLPLLKKEILKSTMRFERLKHHATFTKKCLARNIIPKGLMVEKSISVMASDDEKREALDRDIQRILKSASRQITKAVSKYYQQALAQEYEKLTNLDEEIHTLDLERHEVEDLDNFQDLLLDKRCLLRTKLERKRDEKIQSLQDSLLTLDSVNSHNQGNNSSNTRRARQQMEGLSDSAPPELAQGSSGATNAPGRQRASHRGHASGRHARRTRSLERRT